MLLNRTAYGGCIARLDLNAGLWVVGQHFAAPFWRPLMTKTTKAKNTAITKSALPPTKHQQVIDLLNRDDGASLEELSALANWLPHSTRAYLTGLKNKGHVIDSDKVDGVRRYRIPSSPEA